MAEIVLWSVLVRTLQTALEASTTVVIGFLVAAIMRRMLGSAGTRRLFGGEGFSGLVRAWAIGSLLPVCSLGVIPVAREMRRAGVPAATVLAFILAAPQLNPLSFLYGLTLSEPIVILSFVAAMMVIAIVGGELWKRVFETPADHADIIDEPTPAPGLRRILAVFTTMARDAAGPATLYILAGVLTTGVISGLLPHGYLQNTMKHVDPLSPALMVGFGTPLYSGVLPGMMRIGLMFEHGNSTGASFVLFALGVGFNIGLILQLGFGLGWKRTLLWLLLVTGMVLAVAYPMERLLYFHEEEASHTHAFDDWTSPFSAGTGGINLELALHKFRQRLDPLELRALSLLLGLSLLGRIATLMDRGGRLEAWLTAKPPADKPIGRYDLIVPGPVLGLVSLAGLVVFSVIALYVYYPDPKACFEEISRVRADAITAVRTEKNEDANRMLQRWDLLTRKLQVGILLRTGRMDAEIDKRAVELRELLEEIRDAIPEGDHDKAVSFLKDVEKTHQALRNRCREFLPKTLAIE